MIQVTMLLLQRHQRPVDHGAGSGRPSDGRRRGHSGKGFAQVLLRALVDHHGAGAVGGKVHHVFAFPLGTRLIT